MTFECGNSMLLLLSDIASWTCFTRQLTLLNRLVCSENRQVKYVCYKDIYWSSGSQEIVIIISSRIYGNLTFCTDHLVRSLQKIIALIAAGIVTRCIQILSQDKTKTEYFVLLLIKYSASDGNSKLYSALKWYVYFSSVILHIVSRLTIEMRLTLPNVLFEEKHYHKYISMISWRNDYAKERNSINNTCTWIQNIYVCIDLTNLINVSAIKW